jgi:hypothetical protein
MRAAVGRGGAFCPRACGTVISLATAALDALATELAVEIDGEPPASGSVWPRTKTPVSASAYVRGRPGFATTLIVASAPDGIVALSPITTSATVAWCTVGAFVTTESTICTVIVVPAGNDPAALACARDDDGVALISAITTSAHGIRLIGHTPSRGRRVCDRRTNCARRVARSDESCADRCCDF